MSKLINPFTGEGILETVDNAFCPTGKGGGVDPTCGKNSSGAGKQMTGKGSARPFKDSEIQRGRENLEKYKKMGFEGKRLRSIMEESHQSISLKRFDEFMKVLEKS